FDSVTELTWYEPMPTPDAKKTLAEAVAQCAGLTTGGKWRLPTRIELVTLLDLSKSDTISGAPAATAASELKSMVKMAYWTTSGVRPAPSVPVDPNRQFWTVSFEGKTVLGRASATDTAGVRCVRAE